MMIKPFIIAVVWSYKTAKKTIAFIRGLPMRTHYAIQNTLKSLKKNAAKLNSLIKKGMSKIRQAIHDKLVAPVKNFFMPVINWFKHKIDYITGLVTGFIRAVKDTAKRFIAAVKNALLSPKQTAKRWFQAMVNGIKSLLYKAYNPIKSWIIERAARAKIAKDRFNANMRKGMLEGHKALNSYWKNLRESIYNALKSKASGTIKFLKEIPVRINAFLKKGTDKVNGRVKIMWALVKAPIQVPIALYKAIVILSAKVQNYMKGKISSLVKMLEPIGRVMSEITAFVGQGIKFTGNKIKGRLSPVINWVSKRLEGVVERIRVMLAWSNVLLRYGMFLVAQTANNMGLWFT